MKWLAAAVLLVTAAHFVNLLPTLLGFSRFAFGDCGWPLTTDALLDEGLTPTTDFAYFYGLLTLLINRIVFAVFGRSPETVVAIYGVCTFVIAWGAVRVARALAFAPLPATYLAASAAILTIPRGFPSPAHAIEAALLTTALAEQAAGRLSRALVFATLAVFVKPSLGYFYGLILLVCIFSRPRSDRPRWRALLPATGVGGVVLITLVATFGWHPLFLTQYPLAGMQVYGDDGVGFFFGGGRLFWLPKEPSWAYYRDGIPGPWLASSMVLLVTAVRLVPRWREPLGGFVITCATLHLVFVCLLFGNQWSWIYYPHILFIGTAAALNAWQPTWRAVLAGALVVLVVLGQRFWLWRGDHWWRGQTQRQPETAMLWALPDQAREWGELRELARTSRVLLLTPMGCPQFLAPEVAGPRWWCLMRQTITPAETTRVKSMIADADFLVSPSWHDNDLVRWPELADAIAAFDTEKPVRESPHFKLYRRRP